MERFLAVSNFVKRLMIYAAGLFCLAFGVVFSINSNLGVSPVNSLPYIVSRILNQDMGRCVIVIFSCYILAQIVLLRKEFSWINLTQILFSSLFGYFVDLAKWIMGDFAIPTYPGQLVMLGISIVLVALGVCLYMNVRLVNMPMEGMTHAVNQTLFPRRSFHDVKVIMDCTVVAAGGILSFVCLNRMEGIREGTILCALLVGRVMKPMQKVMVPAIERVVGESG